MDHVLRKNWRNYRKGLAIKRIEFLLGRGLEGPPGEPEQLAELRTAIAAVVEEEQRRAHLVAAQDRARSDRSEVAIVLADTRDELEALRRGRMVNLAYGYANREDTDLPFAEHEARIVHGRSELDRRDEIDRTLANEIASRLQWLNLASQEALSAVVVADPALQALFGALHDAWTRLRSVRTAILSIGEVLPAPLLSRAQAEEYLDPDMRVWPRWRS